MAADVVGFSKMMGTDETATLAALSKLRHSIFEPLVASHRGEVIKRMGDGWLVEFSSALDAVNCAIAAQEKLTDHDTIKLRIGVHLGDVVHDEEGDILGDGVNIAARLESVAKPCGVAISDQVYNSLDGTMTSAFADGGEHELKNITRRIRIWNWSDTSNSDAAVPKSGEDITPVILLEPFSQGGDSEAAADLALELQSGLLNALSNRSGVRVATRTDKGDTPTYLLSGRCRVSGDRCRLHLSITVAANGETFWSTKIDDKVDDIFSFVDGVVDKVSAAIRVHVNAYAGAVYASQSDDGLSIQQLMAKAAFFMHHFDAKNVALSRQTMSTTVARAQDNPMALAMHAYAMMQTIPLAIERVEEIDVDAVLSYANKAVQHGPNVDYVFHNRSRIRLWLRRDHDGCIKDARRALAINPGFHLAEEDLALADIFGGHATQGVENLAKLVNQAAAQPSMAYRLSILAIGHAIIGDMDAAISHAQDGYERKPLVPLHALVYAVAACDTPSIVKSAEFRSMVEQHGLTIDDASRFPFDQEEDKVAIADMLRRSGLPER